MTGAVAVTVAAAGMAVAGMAVAGTEAGTAGVAVGGRYAVVLLGALLPFAVVALALALAAAAAGVGCGWWDIWLTSVGKHCSVCGAPNAPSGNAILVQFTYLSSPPSSFSSLSSSSSPSSSTSSLDDFPPNRRLSPDWSHYRSLFESYGYHLDTVKDVRLYYDHYLAFNPTLASPAFWSGYPDPSEPDNNLCKDRGLPDRLFRGSRKSDGKKIVIKAAHNHSRELSIIRYLSSFPLSAYPQNHTIPVLDIIELRNDPLAFIVQEEWNSSFAHCAPATPRAFLHAVKQCLEGLAFMHSHNVAHLDISRPNILTNCFGAYAYIDFELSRKFSCADLAFPTVCCRRGTELPPEAERGDASCPFKTDIWALGVTLLRASKTTGFEVPGLMSFLQPMLNELPSDRPSAEALLHKFEQTFGLERDRDRDSIRSHNKRK